MFFWCFIEGRVDSFILFVADGICELDTERLALIVGALKIEVSLWKGYVRMVIVVEDNVVRSGDVTLGWQYFAVKLFVLH